MFQLIRLTDGRYAIHQGDTYYVGTISEAIGFMDDLGVPQSEWTLALQQLDEKSHNVADFGIHRLFIYTKFEQQDVRLLLRSVA